MRKRHNGPFLLHILTWLSISIISLSVRGKQKEVAAFSTAIGRNNGKHWAANTIRQHIKARAAAETNMCPNKTILQWSLNISFQPHTHVIYSNRLIRQKQHQLPSSSSSSSHALTIHPKTLKHRGNNSRSQLIEWRADWGWL